MRRIDQIKNKKMKNVKYVKVIDKKRLEIMFITGVKIIVKAEPEDYGYDSGIYIEEDTI